ncbi:MAG: hypothetical protein WC517_00670 [Patescibacteria group bacterium]
MTIFAWTTLIILSFIFIFLGLALIVFFTFFYNDGASPALGAALLLLAVFVIAAILPYFTASPVVPAATIAAALLVSSLGLVIRFFLPCLDNKDVIIAVRPILAFSIASGFLVAILNLARVFIV